jgi:hypothetical protein
VLAHHRHVFDFDLRELALVLAVYANPVSRAALGSLFGIGDR